MTSAQPYSILIENPSLRNINLYSVNIQLTPNDKLYSEIASSSNLTTKDNKYKQTPDLYQVFQSSVCKSNIDHNYLFYIYLAEEKSVYPENQTRHSTAICRFWYSL